MIGMINVGNKKSVNISKVYGVRRNIKSSSSAWERIKDSVGLVANAQVGTTAVVNNFDSIYPWSDIITCNYNNTSKKIVAYYGDANFSFTGSNGQVLTIIPEFYYKGIQRLFEETRLNLPIDLRETLIFERLFLLLFNAAIFGYTI